MKRFLSLILVFAYMVCMIPVLADGTSANLDSVTVSGAVLYPAFSSDVLSYDVVVDDENAALSELTITGQYELVKKAIALGDKTIVSASGTNYEFTYRAPYTKGTTLTEPFISRNHSAMSSANTTYQSSSTAVLMANPENPSRSNPDYIPVFVFDFTHDTVNVNPFGKFEISLAFATYVANIDAEIKAVNSDNTWINAKGTYENVVTGDPAFDEDTKVLFNTNSAVKDGNIYVIKLDVSDMVREKLLKGGKKVTLAVKMKTVSSSQLKVYGEGAGSTKYKSTINYYDIVKGSDATLKSVTVKKGSLNKKFSPTEYSYEVNHVGNPMPEFEYVLSDSHANAVIEKTNENDGTTTITVTAPDGMVNTYTFKYNLVEPDATLSSVKVKNDKKDAVLLGDFDSKKYEYQIAVKDGVTPDFEYEAAFSDFVTVDVNAATGSEGTSTITVTTTNESEEQKVYTFNHIPFDSDATLKSVAVTGGILNPKFNSSITAYDIEIPKGITPDVKVEGTPNSQYAKASSASGTALNQTIKVTVTALDGTEKVYSFKLIEEPERSTKMLSADVAYGTIAPSFNSDVTNYLVGIEPNIAIPDINFALEDPNATVTVTKATKIGETTSVKVVNGSKTRTYNFKFVIKYLNGETKEIKHSDIGKISTYNSGDEDKYHDYHIESDGKPGNDYMVQLKTNAKQHADVWLKLDLTGKEYNPFGQFKFKFYAASTGVDGINYLVRTTSSSNWDGRNSENPSITYNNTLGNGMFYNEAYAQEIVTGAAEFKEVDITNMVQAELAKGNEVITVAVALSGTPAEPVSLRFRNKEETEYVPSFFYDGIGQDTGATIETIDIKNGVLIGEFKPDVKNYTVAVEEGKTPSYSYVLTSNYATVDITYAKKIGETTVIKLTSQDGFVNEYKFTHKSFADGGVNENGKFSVVDTYMSDVLGKKITTLTSDTTIRFNVSYSNFNTNKKKITLVTVVKTNGQIDDIKISTKEVGTETSKVYEEILLPYNVEGLTVEGYVYDFETKTPLFKKVSAPKETAYTSVISNATDKLAKQSYGSKVIIYGKATPNTLVPVIAVKPGTVLSSLTKDDKSMVAVFDIALSDANGIWEKEVEFPTVEGWYKIYAGGVSDYVEHYVSLIENKENSVKNIYDDIFDSADKETAKADIKAFLNTTSGTAANKDVIGITSYPTLNEDDLIENIYNIAKETYEEKPTVTDSEAYVTAFFDVYEKAVTISKLNAGEECIAEDVIALFELNDLTSLYNTVPYEYKKEVNKMLKGDNIKGKDDVEKLVKKAVSYNVINYPENPTIAQNTIETYGTLLGFDLSGYNNLNNKSTVISYFVNGGPFDSISSMTTYFGTCVSTYGTTGGGNGGGGGGGGSGSDKGSYSGSITGGKVDTPPVYTDDLNPDSKDKKVFSDVEVDNWAYNPTKFLSEKGIVQGVGDGKYEPSRTVAREEFTKIICLAFNVENGEKDIEFTDVKKDSWYYEYVKNAVAVGALKGISDTEFGSGQGLRREDAALIIYRVLKLEAKKGETFGDDSEIADYAKDAVYTLKEMGVLSGTGNGNFEPKRTVTRAECAKIIYELIKE